MAKATYCSATATTIKAASAASDIAICTIWVGDITVASVVSRSVDLGYLEKIDGSLTLRDWSGNGTFPFPFSALALEIITGSLILENLEGNPSLGFPVLTSVDTMELGHVNQSVGPLYFPPALRDAKFISVQHTNASELSGLSSSSFEWITIANNDHLDSIDLGIVNISDALTVRKNDPNLNVSLPNLAKAGSMTLSDISVLSTPSLVYLGDYMKVFDTFITELKLPKMLGIERRSIIHEPMDGMPRGIWISNNPYMTDISLPALQSMNGSLSIQNNTQLATLEDMDSLQTLTGDVSLIGPFTKVSFPALLDVEGAFHLQSSKPVSCDSLDKLNRTEVFRGGYTCASTFEVSNSTTHAGTHESLTKGAKAGIGVGVGIGCLVILAVLAYLLWRKRKTNTRALSTAVLEKDGYEIDAAAMLSSDGQRYEMGQPPSELPLGGEAQELPTEYHDVEVRSVPTMKAL